MTDPKLNEIPADARDLTDEQRNERARRPRSGLSIKDTVAGDANLSVGGQGVDTSGVKAGAGAGGGSTNLTAGRSGSPAPNVVPGAASTGTTPRGDSGMASSPNPGADIQRDESIGPTNDEIAVLAHRFWIERGRPHGSPEVDWNRARLELIEERRRRAKKTISASV